MVSEILVAVHDIDHRGEAGALLCPPDISNDRRAKGIRPATPALSSGSPPLVWAILCYRSGDNEQILALAEALGWPFEVKRLAYRPYGRTIDVFRPTTLAGILKDKSDPLVAPWPDVIISASMRNEPVCRWIQRQADHPVRYIHIGRPWAFLKNFDLIITQPQYRLRRRPNVLELPLCLHRVSEQRLDDAARTWLPRLAHLPRPFIAVLVGGSGGPYALDPYKAERLARDASVFANERRGSLLVSTSSRTAPAAVDAVAAAIGAPAYVHRWQPQATDNPYFAFLALADAIIVTCDSVSMLTEACATGKPVYMFDLGPNAEEPLASLSLRDVLRRLRERCRLDRLKAFLYRNLVHVPPSRMTRDLGRVYERLIATGRAVWLGQHFSGNGHRETVCPSIALARVRALFERDECGVAVDERITPAAAEQPR